jgi:hypothetical protein
MLLSLFANNWDIWQLYHKVTFDGVNKLMIINYDVSAVSVKNDIFSDWKEWVAILDNAKYLQAMRSVGGDPIGGGQYAGDMYFLMNGWKIYADHSVLIDGVVYSEDGLSPFVVPNNTNIVQNKVSNIVNTVSVGGSTSDPFLGIMEGSTTYQQAMRLMSAILLGKTNIVDLGGGNAQVTFRDTGDTKDRVIADMTGSNRTNVTKDAS